MPDHPRDDEDSPGKPTELSATETGSPSPAGSTEQIGPYRLLGKLGEGGMGEVWLAEQHQPVKRKVALKVIKQGMDTKQVVARFAAEKQALALMDHPAIAKVYDAGATPQGRPYFAMEYVKGVPITEYCDRHRLTNRERLRLSSSWRRPSGRLRRSGRSIVSGPPCRPTERSTPTGVLDGDLIVSGGGDPDFHVENAQLLANTLRKRGIRRVTGTLYVNDAFWIGWENGSEGRVDDPAARAEKMATRLAKAWNPRTWTPQTLRAMREFQQRTDDVEFLSLPIGRVAGLYDGEEPGELLAEHQSNPLVTILKRFNDFSNNDIERLGHLLGDARAMTEFYRSRW